MLKRWMLPLLFAAISAAQAQGAAPAGALDDGRSLARACRSVERVWRRTEHGARIAITTDALLCLGYMQAMQDLSALADESQERLLGSCPPDNSTLRELIQVFVDYSGSHPDALDDRAALAVVKSFQAAYPCISRSGD